MLTTAEAAARLGLTDRRIRQLIEGGQLPATRHGRDWAIEVADLARVSHRPAAGWPKGRPRKPPQPV